VNAGDTVFLLDGNGIVDKRDVPVNVHARERFDAALEKGTLRVLDESAVEEYISASGGILFRLKQSAPPKVHVETPAPPTEPAPAGDSGAPSDTPAGAAQKPAKSAGVGAWREFAIAQGMDAEAAAAADKKALVAQFGS
jgi:hypothetical protein